MVELADCHAHLRRHPQRGSQRALRLRGQLSRASTLPAAVCVKRRGLAAEGELNALEDHVGCGECSRGLWRQRRSRTGSRRNPAEQLHRDSVRRAQRLVQLQHRGLRLVELQRQPEHPRFWGQFAGPMHTGTYGSTDAGANGAVNATPNSSSSQTWTAAAGSSSQGSYTMSLTDLGSSVALGSGLAYPGVHGTLDATLPAAASTGASGTVTLHAVF